jgi:hypothetical protein
VNNGTGVAGIDQAVVWSVTVAALAGGMGVMWRATRSLRRLLGRLDEFADDWQGVSSRPGVPGHEGVMARLGSIEARLTAVEHELRPNSGGSMRDAIDRVDARLSAAPGPSARP